MALPNGIVRQFFTFAAVGIAGFVVDAGVLTLLLHTTSVGPYLGRVCSYLCAATFTWVMNKFLTFRDRSSQRLSVQWLTFLLVNACGGLVNFGIYSLLLATIPFFAATPVAAVAIGSLAGLAVNFTLSRNFVFRRPAA